MEEFILKDNPQIKLILFNDRFVLHQSDEQPKEYFLSEVDSLQIGKRVNWLVSIFSFIVGFFIGGSGEVYKERDQLKVNYEGKSVLISLKGADRAKVITAVDRVNQFLKEQHKTI